jgi:hypothetical protein
MPMHGPAASGGRVATQAGAAERELQKAAMDEAAAERSAKQQVATAKQKAAQSAKSGARFM